MLVFIEEEQSGQLVAHSEEVPFRTYWIDEAAWFYLTVVQGDRAGANVGKSETYRSLAAAKVAANGKEQGQ